MLVSVTIQPRGRLARDDWAEVQGLRPVACDRQPLPSRYKQKVHQLIYVGVVIGLAECDSKTEPRGQLEGSRAAGAEDLIEAARGLAKRRGVGQVATVARQVGDIKEVERFAD